MGVPGLPEPVLIVGTGLLGTSIGLALREYGVEVYLSDTSPGAARLARDMGAGDLVSAAAPTPGLVVVATPPDVTAAAVIEALKFDGAFVTDVASVKGPIEAEVRRAAGPDASRYVGSHPMAGRERSGAAAADADLFRGRTWVICAHDGAAAEASDAMRALAGAVGGLPYEMPAGEHDSAVAAVSHLPQLMASLTAAQLDSLHGDALSLAGQGLRDTTRIAASDPMLWSAILAANAAAVLPHAEAALAQFEEIVAALRTAAGEGAHAVGVTGAFARLIEQGRTGVSRIPGKHGGAARRYAEVTVLVPDTPGQLGRLFGEVGEAGVNVEDFRMEHSAGANYGVATIFVVPSRELELADYLEAHGWRVMGA